MFLLFQELFDHPVDVPRRLMMMKWTEQDRKMGDFIRVGFPEAKGKERDPSAYVIFCSKRGRKTPTNRVMMPGKISTFIKEHLLGKTFTELFNLCSFW